MSSISIGAWIAVPVLTFFWIYKGWTFMRSLVIALIIDGIIYFFSERDLLGGITFILMVSSALWVYGDAEVLKVRFRFVFVIISFLIPPVGIIIYLSLRRMLSKIKIEKIKSSDGVIEIHT
jgi:hypothetical protein